jgi:hypothetical protein
MRKGSSMPPRKPTDKSLGLTIRERVMIEKYVHLGGKKVEAYALAFMEQSHESMSDGDKLSARIKATGKWQEIEKKLGGFNGILQEMGLDDVSLIKETLRLTRIKKPLYVKNAVETTNPWTGEKELSNIVWYDDGLAQAKGVEMFHRIRGSFNESLIAQEQSKGSPLRLEFGNFGKLEDADNVQIFIGGKKEEVIKEGETSGS